MPFTFRSLFSPAARAASGLSLSFALLALAPGALAQAVYVPNYTTSNISGYLIDPLSGVLSAVSGTPVVTGTSPVQALVHPSGKFLYVLDAGSGDVSLYSISAPSG